jgi:hypothetical protein
MPLITEDIRSGLLELLIWTAGSAMLVLTAVEVIRLEIDGALMLVFFLAICTLCS